MEEKKQYHCIVEWEKKEEILLSPTTKDPTTTEKSKKHHKNICYISFTKIVCLALNMRNRSSVTFIQMVYHCGMEFELSIINVKISNIMDNTRNNYKDDFFVSPAKHAFYEACDAWGT